MVSYWQTLSMMPFFQIGEIGMKKKNRAATVGIVALVVCFALMIGSRVIWGFRIGQAYTSRIDSMIAAQAAAQEANSEKQLVRWEEVYALYTTQEMPERARREMLSYLRFMIEFFPLKLTDAQQARKDALLANIDAYLGSYAVSESDFVQAESSERGEAA